MDTSPNETYDYQGVRVIEYLYFWSMQLTISFQARHICCIVK